MMDLEWDDDKNKINIEKHGIDFKDAVFVFSGKVITFKDDRNDYGEDRFITLGELEKRVIVVIHTQRAYNLRIISMRKANEREKKIYFKRLEESG